MHMQSWVDDGVGIIQWSRGKLNPVDEALGRAVAKAVEGLAIQREIKAIVLTGAGGSFSAGGDLARAWQALKQGDDPAEVFRRYTDWVGRTVQMLWQVSKPVVSAVEGVAAGAGLGWILASDLVVAGRGARILPGFARVGLVSAAGITWALARGLGAKWGMWWLGFNRELSAEQAAKWGVVDRVVEDGAALPEAIALARKAAKGRWVKPGLRAGWAQGLDRHMLKEQKAVMAASREREFAKRMKGFFER